jgi:hypothetical protein
MTQIRSAAALASVALAGLTSAVHAGAFNAVVTADNHYALYVDGPSGIQFIGGNELGAGGAPGTYNWSKAESITFDTARYIYIAAWSDDRVAQGLIAQITGPAGLALHTGVAPWQVMMTNSDRDDGASYPAAAAIASFTAFADANNLWESPAIGAANVPATNPWGKIAGITEEARWIWGNPKDVSNPFVGGKNHGEYQIFRLAVPTPGSIALGLMGSLLLVRRRGR